MLCERRIAALGHLLQAQDLDGSSAFGGTNDGFLDHSEVARVDEADLGEVITMEEWLDGCFVCMGICAMGDYGKYLNLMLL